MEAIIISRKCNELEPLNDKSSDLLLNVVNKRIIDYIIGFLNNNGIHKTTIITDNNITDLRNYIDKNYQENKNNISIEYLSQEKNPISLLETYVNDTTLLINGNIITDCDISYAIDFHKRRNSIFTIITKNCNNKSEFGYVLTDYDGLVVECSDKRGISDIVNCGIYIIEPYAFENKDLSSIEKELIPHLVSTNEMVFGCEIAEYWANICNLKTYSSAFSDILDGKCNTFKMVKDKYGNYIGNNVRVSQNARIKPPVFIGDNVTVGEHTVIEPYSFIGEGTIIGRNNNIKNSIIMKHTSIGDSITIRGAVIGKNCIISNGVNIYENVVLADNVSVGEWTNIFESVKVWENKILAPRKDYNSDIKWSDNYEVTENVGNLLNTESALKIGKYIAYINNVGSYDNVIALSTDGNPISVMLLHSAVSGVISSGADAIKISPAPVFVLKHMIKQNYFAGGIYLLYDEENNKPCAIIFDESGREYDLNKFMINALKVNYKDNNIYGVGIIEDLQAGPYEYISEIMEKADVDSMRNYGGVLLISADLITKRMISELFYRLGWKCIYTDKSEEELLREKNIIGADIACELRRMEMKLYYEHKLDNSVLDNIIKNYKNSDNKEYDIVEKLVIISELISKGLFNELYELNNNIKESIKTLSCNEDERAKIIRTVSENAYKDDIWVNENDFEINEKNGKVKITNSVNGKIKIIASNANYEYAQELCDIYDKRLRNILYHN